MSNTSWILSVTITTNSSDLLDDTHGEKQENLNIVALLFWIVIAIYGAIGNILIIIAVTSKRRLRKRSNAFIFNLALVDFLICAYIMTLSIVTSQLEYIPFDDIGCSVNGFLTTMLCCGTMQALMLVAIERYFHICQISRFKRWFTPRRIILYITVMWIYSIAWSLLGFSGWTRFRYSRNVYLCLIDVKYSITFNISFVIFTIVIPLSVIAMCYFSIFNLVLHNRTVMRHHSMAIHRNKKPEQTEYFLSKRQKRKAKKELNTAFMLVAIIFLVFIFWSPSAVVIVCSTFVRVPGLLYTFAAWMMFSNSAVNSLIYGIMNKNFRIGYIHMFNKVFRCHINTEDQVDWQFSRRDQNNTSSISNRLDIRINRSSPPSTTTGFLETSFSKAERDYGDITPRYGTYLNVPESPIKPRKQKRRGSGPYGLETLIPKEHIVKNPMLPQITVLEPADKIVEDLVFESNAVTSTLEGDRNCLTVASL